MSISGQNNSFTADQREYRHGSSRARRRHLARESHFHCCSSSVYTRANQRSGGLFSGQTTALPRINANTDTDRRSRCTGTSSPNTSRTAARRPFAPSRTTRSPAGAVNPRSTSSRQNAAHTRVFSVAVCTSPRRRVSPVVVTPKAITTWSAAKDVPSSTRTSHSASSCRRSWSVCRGPLVLPARDPAQQLTKHADIVRAWCLPLGVRRERHLGPGPHIPSGWVEFTPRAPTDGQRRDLRPAGADRVPSAARSRCGPGGGGANGERLAASRATSMSRSRSLTRPVPRPPVHASTESAPSAPRLRAKCLCRETGVSEVSRVSGGRARTAASERRGIRPLATRRSTTVSTGGDQR